MRSNLACLSKITVVKKTLIKCLVGLTLGLFFKWSIIFSDEHGERVSDLLEMDIKSLKVKKCHFSRDN